MKPNNVSKTSGNVLTGKHGLTLRNSTLLGVHVVLDGQHVILDGQHEEQTDLLALILQLWVPTVKLSL